MQTQTLSIKDKELEVKFYKEHFYPETRLQPREGGVQICSVFYKDVDVTRFLSSVLLETIELKLLEMQD